MKGPLLLWKRRKLKKVMFTILEFAAHRVISVVSVYSGIQTHLKRAVSEAVTYLRRSIWIIVCHVDAVHNETKGIKTVILE